MPSPILTAGQLNRATLARQMLLVREKASPLSAVHRLGGLQAQLARPPYIALWSRIEGFRREDLTEVVNRRELVRGTLMRGTLHLCAASDYLVTRPLLQPMLSKALRSVLKDRADVLDIDGLLAATRSYLAAGPRTFEEIRDHLESLKLPGDERARGYAVRLNLPLVQVPDGSAWGYPGNAAFALADTWIGQASSPATPSGGKGKKGAATAGGKGDKEEVLSGAVAVVAWYLRAFGPASVADAQSWSGVASLKEAFEQLRPQLTTFRDERGRELFDFPDAPRPDGDTPAPVRFLPEFDALGLAHDDRSRLVDDTHRKLLFRPNLRNPPMFLVDGRVAGTWEIEAKKKLTSIVLTPYVKLTKKVQEELGDEGEAMGRFIEPDAKAHDVRIVTAAKGS